MFLDKIKIATATTLLALMTCGGPCRADLPEKDAWRFAGETVATGMFPDGITYNFGKVPRGPLVRHSFRIVNTSSVPLEITSVRVG